MYQPEPYMISGGGQGMSLAPPYGGGWGGYQPQYQQQAQPTGAALGDKRLQKLSGRLQALQDQYGGAGTEQQAQMQGRLDSLRGRVKGLRKDRRRGTGLYDPSAQAPSQGAQPDIAQVGNSGARPEPAMLQGGGGYGYGGGYNPQMMMSRFAYQPQMQQLMQGQAMGGGYSQYQPQMQSFAAMAPYLTGRMY